MSQIKLHVLQGACPLVPHTALAMAKASDNIDYDIIIMNREALKSAEYLALNPKGSAPLLRDGEFVLSQNFAILSYINAKFPKAHIFGKGDEQHIAKTLQWLAFVNSDLHPSFKALFNPNAVLPNADENLVKALQQQAKENIVNLLRLSNDELNNKDFLNGEFTIADMYLYVTLRWATAMQIDFSQHTNLAKFIKNVENLPFVLQTLKEQELAVL